MSEKARPRKSKHGVVRFAVGTLDGPRSNVWRLWTQNDEVYVSARGIESDFKASLHSSGRWRVGFTQKVAKRQPDLGFPGGDRALLKWRRPFEEVPGWTNALVIIVPASEVVEPRSPRTEPSLARKDIVWVPRASDGYATWFCVFFTAPWKTAEFEALPGDEREVPGLIWRFLLPNGETVWVTQWEDKLPEEFREELLEEKRYAAEAYDFSAVGEPRGVATCTFSDGTCGFVDLARQPAELT